MPTLDELKNEMLNLYQELSDLKDVQITTFEEANAIRVSRENALEKLRLLQAQFTILTTLSQMPN